MFELFENLTNWLWGLPLLITILATGVYLTVRSGFFQFRHFGYIVKNMFSKERRQEGGDDGKSLTPFQAISIAIGVLLVYPICPVLQRLLQQEDLGHYSGSGSQRFLPWSSRWQR